MLNMDFEKVMSLDPAKGQWVRSPGGEVLRFQLERAAGEKGHATSLVRYPKGAQFPMHSHPGGEEFYVLEGTFSDEKGDYSQGTYVRNPIGSLHSPWSKDGCLIFVKLWQMHPLQEDRYVSGPNSSAICEQLLYEDKIERVYTKIFHHETSKVFQGTELLVIEGEATFEGLPYGKHSWIRIPKGKSFTIHFPHGGQLWIKEKKS